MTIGFQEGNIFLFAKLTREFVDVHRFIILVYVVILEGLLGHEVDNVTVLVYAYHRTIHPRFILGYQRQVGVQVFYYHGEQTVAEYQIAFYQQGVILRHLLFHQRQRIDVVGFVVNRILCVLYGQLVVIAMPDVVHQFLSLIAHNDDDPVERKPRQLS